MYKSFNLLLSLYFLSSDGIACCIPDLTSISSKDKTPLPAVDSLCVHRATTSTVVQAVCYSHEVYITMFPFLILMLKEYMRVPMCYNLLQWMSS